MRYIPGMILRLKANFLMAIAACALLVLPVTAQDTPAALAIEEKKEETWGMFPLLVPLYSPETRFMVAGGGIFWYNPWPEAPRKRTSRGLSTAGRTRS